MMPVVQVVFDARIYRVTFDVDDNEVHKIERYNRFVLSRYVKDGKTNYMMEHTDKPTFSNVWLRSTSRPIGAIYRRIINKARQELAAGRTLEIHPSRPPSRKWRGGTGLSVNRKYSGIPDATEREINEMVEQGLSF